MNADLPPIRIALFALEALPNARPLRQFINDNASEIVFVGLSNPQRPAVGGFARQTYRHLRQSGPLIMPYLMVNFVAPILANILHGWRRRQAGADPCDISILGLCRHHGITAKVIDDINCAKVQDCVKREAPDLIVSFHFDQIFAEATLAIAPLGGINVHPSLLPRHRGPTPCIYALGEAVPSFGVTVHRISKTIDGGNILAQAVASLQPGVSATYAAAALHEHGRCLLGLVLKQIKLHGIAVGLAIKPGPYNSFPSSKMLRKMLFGNRRLATGGDLLMAFGWRTISEERFDVVLDPAGLPILSSPN